MLGGTTIGMLLFAFARLLSVKLRVVGSPTGSGVFSSCDEW
jgi:hypothetical protein